MEEANAVMKGAGHSISHADGPGKVSFALTFFNKCFQEIYLHHKQALQFPFICTDCMTA